MQFNDSKVLVIHRLVVHPNKQNKGYAKLLMDFAEDYAKQIILLPFDWMLTAKTDELLRFIKTVTTLLEVKTFYWTEISVLWHGKKTVDFLLNKSRIYCLISNNQFYSHEF
jgi:GNAT superfamily N-acetyltransferase